jgi:hypothetical protein
MRSTVDDESMLKELQERGYVSENGVSRWRELGSLLAVLDAIGKDGASALLKVDGERQKAVYTVVISGGRLGEAFFRKDADDVHALLREAIDFYRAHVWGHGK